MSYRSMNIRSAWNYAINGLNSIMNYRPWGEKEEGQKECVRVQTLIRQYRDLRIGLFPMAFALGVHAPLDPTCSRAWLGAGDHIKRVRDFAMVPMVVRSAVCVSGRPSSITGQWCVDGLGGSMGSNWRRRIVANIEQPFGSFMLFVAEVSAFLGARLKHAFIPGVL